MSSVTQIMAERYYQNGSALIYVIRVEPDGGALVEDAKSSELIYMTTEELDNFNQVPDGNA
jgi:hypothetical protein